MALRWTAADRARNAGAACVGKAAKADAVADRATAVVGRFLRALLRTVAAEAFAARPAALASVWGRFGIIRLAERAAFTWIRAVSCRARETAAGVADPSEALPAETAGCLPSEGTD
jgi:hypothetical protein